MEKNRQIFFKWSEDLFKHYISSPNLYICGLNEKGEILKQIISAVNKTEPDSEIYLYGSQARNEEKSHSDWDILILLNSENLSFALETKFMDELYEVELETGEVIAPLIYTKSDWKGNHGLTPLHKNIQRDAIKIKRLF